MKKCMLVIFCIVLICSITACGTQQPDGNEAADIASSPIDEKQDESAEATELAEYGEPVIYQWVELNENEPCFEIVVPVKNTSDELICFGSNTYTLTDKDGNEIEVFEGSDCAPMYLEPGQEGIIYYAAINRSGLDYLNPEYSLDFVADPMTVNWDVTQLEVSDIQLSRNLGDTEIRGNLINDTDKEFELPAISILFYDKDGNILCGAYGMGGVNDSAAEDFGVLHAKTTCPFCTYRYWLPNDYPLDDVTVKAFAAGNAY